MNWDTLVIRYGEMSTKGNNKSDFEKALIRTLEGKLEAYPDLGYSRISGRVLVHLGDKVSAQVAQMTDTVSRIFGIRSVSPALSVPLSLEAIMTAAKKLAHEHLNDHPDIKSFKAEVVRANKGFPGTSMEIAREVGHQLGEMFPSLSVDVHRPDMTVWIEIRERAAYVYVNRVAGPGGLPMGTSGRVGLLLSGGIDSPVAGWYAMRRGVTVDAVHFHSFPFTSERAQAKVEQLVSELAVWSSSPIRLFNISVTEIQSAIQKHSPEFMRTVVLRRMMVRIATELASRQEWLALVTGDSLGQVASQTLEGINVTDQVTSLPILRPLVTMDKTEIIAQAESIGTYETSILPYDDCCSLFAPKSPRTRPTRAQTEQAEASLIVSELVQTALKTMETKVIYQNQ